MEPYPGRDTNLYVSYYHHDTVPLPNNACLRPAVEAETDTHSQRAGAERPRASRGIGNELRTYDLVVATTAEWVTLLNESR